MIPMQTMRICNFGFVFNDLGHNPNTPKHLNFVASRYCESMT